jgi:hypothetical protein
METLLKKLDGPETEPQQITGHEFSDVNASKKASHLKRKLTFLVTLAITFAAFLMTACDDGGVDPCTNCPPPPPPPPMFIRGTSPSSAAPGSTVHILGENFDALTSDTYVTFGSSYAEILYINPHAINVRLPMDIPEGDYRISVSSNGQSAAAPNTFTVIKGTR